MTLTLQVVNFAISIVGMSICVLGLILTLGDRIIEPWIRRFFVSLFLVLALYVSCNVFGQFSEGRPGEFWKITNRLLLFFESLLSALTMPMLTRFLLLSCGEYDWRRKPVYLTVGILLLAYVVLLVFAQFSTEIYYFDEYNRYHRGYLYPLLLVPPILIMLLNGVALWRRRGKLEQRQKVAFATYILAPLISMLIQSVSYGLYVIILGTTIAAAFLFVQIQREQTEQYLRREEENRRLKTDIMLSQIQPHFLYNALGVIQSLCKTDPAAAETAVIEFARYLRGNMDSLSADRAIPFTQELDHTKVYLELEKLRYEDALKVNYDLKCTEFRLPALSLQPLAENAVRHGIRQNLSGSGTVTIASREYADRYEVTVSDDGPGFDSEQKPGDDRSHIGLSNVKARMERMIGGSLKIESVPGTGTKVTILIPKEGV